MGEGRPVQTPQYLRIRRQIEAKIRRGELCPGQRIQGERDLAREFGVSQMTANRAIQELVRDGWLRRRAGSGTFVSDAHEAPAPLSQQTVVVVTPFTDQPEYDAYLRLPFTAISRGAAETDHSVLVAQSAPDRFPALVDRFPRSGFIFMAPGEASRGVLEDLWSNGVPLVVLGASWPGAPFACVDSDNVTAQRTAVDYVAMLGHERIGFVHGPLLATNNRDRAEGYRTGMAAHGLEIDPAWMAECETDVQCLHASRQAILDMLLRPDPVTAILCAGFVLTLNVLSILQSLDLPVPERVSIVGFDDPPGAEHLSPPLTTLRQPLSTMGERAVQRVLALASGIGPDDSGVELLPIELVLRASCARIK